MSVCIGKDMGCRCQTCDSMLDCAPSPPAAPEPSREKELLVLLKRCMDSGQLDYKLHADAHAGVHGIRWWINDSERTPEHPDTIALRGCRAELEFRNTRCKASDAALMSARAEQWEALEERNVARAELDTALRDIENERKVGDALQKSRDTWRRTATARQEELDTALARIAELEAEQRGAEKDLRLITENNAGHVARITRAVAELEKAKRMSPGRWVDECITAALEALR